MCLGSFLLDNESTHLLKFHLSYHMDFWTRAWEKRLEKDTLLMCGPWVSSSDGCQLSDDNVFNFSARLSEKGQPFFCQYDTTCILFGCCLYTCSQKKKPHLSSRLPEPAPGHRCPACSRVVLLDSSGPHHTSASTTVTSACSSGFVVPPSRE